MRRIWLHFRGIVGLWFRLSLPAVVFLLWFQGLRGLLAGLLLAPSMALVYAHLWWLVGESCRLPLSWLRRGDFVLHELAAALVSLTAARFLQIRAPWPLAVLALAFGWFFWRQSWRTSIPDLRPGKDGIPEAPEFLPPVRIPASVMAEFRGYDPAHSGIDLGVPPGTPVYAPAAGRVVFAGPHGSAGLCLHLEHADGWSTFYAHLDRLAVQKGDHVHPGMLIAYSGSTGVSTGPHLHVELRYRGQPVWPGALFSRSADVNAAGPQPLTTATRR